MILLSGNNLPKRQHELNIQVNKAASKNVPFDKIKAETENSDVDRLFKIDVAAKYKNIEYVIETLKSGDSLYISRVLKKCLWLYDDEFSNIINTDYLHLNIFPLMSIKMKKKLLASVSMNVKNENHAADFYNYCKKTKLCDYAYKFLINTSESFKIELLQKNVHNLHQRDSKYLKLFLGNSLILFEAYLQCDVWNKNSVIHDCSYLYTVSDVKYLDLLEKHVKIESGKPFTLGLRISKDIVVKHKQRIVAHPDLYLSILNLGKLLRHSSINEVEFYTAFIFPNNVPEFWKKHHQTKFRQIINVVPEHERYAFAKKIFADKYHNEEFEMSKQFYNEKYYSLMTPAEREDWAIRQLASGKEILGSGKDYIWYKFINFDKAFTEVKKCILTTTDKTKRSDLLKVLAQSAKSNQELEKLIHYYYERHVNENKSNKSVFLHGVMAHHNVFKFDENCWAAFTKILYSIKVYDAAGDPEFKTVAILYHILNDKPIPNSLIQFMEQSMAMYSIHFENIDAESQGKVYDYIFKFYLDRILEFKPGCKDDKVVLYVHFLLEILVMFKKTKADIPDIVMEFVRCDRNSYKYQRILEEPDTRLTENYLMKCLKKDSKLLIEKLPEINKVIVENWYFKMKRLLNKLKVYFSKDIAKQFIKLFDEWLNRNISDSVVTNAAVYGIFQLCEGDYKICFMNKYAPQSPKIEHDKIDRTFLYTQEAICRFACYSRPPVPLLNILMYLKGDYVRFCLPMFNRYLTNLPMPICLQFVESLIDAPVSIQKHGLRLAFQCFSAENLKTLVLNAWKNTKNVSLRSIIYKALFEKTANEPDKEQCNVLTTLTLDLHDTDDDDLFSHYKLNKLPAEFSGEFVEALWQTVKTFKDNEQNLSRKTNIIKFMDDKMYFMKKETIKEVVSEHVKTMFNKNDTNIENVQKYKDLYLAKWVLVTHFIEYFTSNVLDLSESIEIAKFIVSECLKRWNEVLCDIYVFRKLYHEFIENLNSLRWVLISGSKGNLPDTKSFVNAIPIFEAILTNIEAALPLHEVYIDVWTLRIMITVRRLIKESRIRYQNDDGLKAIEETAAKFGREVGNMVKEAVDKHMLFAYFLNDIKKLVCNGASDIEIHLTFEKKVSIERQDIELLVARGLLELNIKETNLLALQIVPLDKKCNLDLYKSVYNTLKENPDTEIQCCMFKKFCGDYKRRRLD